MAVRVNSTIDCSCTTDAVCVGAELVGGGDKA